MVILSVKPVTYCNFFYGLTLVLGSIGGFQHGYHMAVLNVPANITYIWIFNTSRPSNDTIREMEGVSSEYIDLIYLVVMLSFFVGGVMGAALAALAADFLGRRLTLIAVNVFLGVGCAFMGISTLTLMWLLCFIGRTMIGFHAGVNSVVAPMYLVEVSPVSLRGMAGSVYFFMFSWGLLTAVVAGLPDMLGTMENWPWLFLVPVFPALIQMCVLVCMPESPKYLYFNEEDEEKTEESLFKLRNRWYIEPDMVELEDEAQMLLMLPSASLFTIFDEMIYKIPVVLSIGLVFTAHIVGMVIFYVQSSYVMDVFFNEHDPQYVTLTLAVMNLFGATFGILFVEFIGRRFTVITGVIGSMACTALFSIFYTIEPFPYQAYFCLFILDLFVFMYAMTLGPCCYFYIHELMSHFVRSIGGALAISMGWILQLIIIVAFIPFLVVVEYYMFWIFFIFDFFCLLFAIYFLPETHARSSCELIELFEENDKYE